MPVTTEALTWLRNDLMIRNQLKSVSAVSTESYRKKASTEFAQLWVMKSKLGGTVEPVQAAYIQYSG